MKCLKRFAIFVFTTKTTQSRTQVFLVNCSIICNWAAFLTSSVHYGKMLSNLVGNSWLWWIMRGILASQKQRNIILEWIIITFINGYTVFCAVYIVLTHFRQVLAEMNGTIFISRISVMNMTAKRIKKTAYHRARWYRNTHKNLYYQNTAWKQKAQYLNTVNSNVCLIPCHLLTP